MADTTNGLCAKCNKDNASMRCSRCKATHYCSTECQTNDWANHKPDCVPENIVGIIVKCSKDRRPGIFESVNISAAHDIHRLGELCPVTKVVGLPLIAYRHIREPWMKRADDASLDNQIATYLMINRDGFAPPEWQKQVGTVTFMRKDGKPLTKEALETIWMYNDELLDLFSDGASVAQRTMNRASFERYCKRYKEEQLRNGHNRFREMPVPL